jgi:diguanylate cyclase (GGDEF)-like protein/PAS domain S-box-containing protein
MEGFKLIAEISLTIINKDDYDTQMNHVLRILGEYFDVSRTYIFLDNDENTITQNAYEWCNKGITPQIENLQGVEYSLFPSWNKLLLSEGKIFAANILELPDDLVATLQQQEVCSIIVYPILIGQKIKGFIGFDECISTKVWSETTHKLLEITSHIIGSAYEKNTYYRGIKEKGTRLNNIIEGTRLGTWEWHIQTGEVVFNERWAEIIGYKLDEIQPSSIETWIKYANEDDLKESDYLLKEHFKGESDYYEIECRMRHKSGEWIWVHDRGKVIEWDEEGKPLKMFGTHFDITEKKEMENKIRSLTIRDPLTNAYNRRYIFEKLEPMIAMSKRDELVLSISILDIDWFKKVNDEYGHLAGDYVLKELTSIIMENLRAYDILGRYGGEEFIIVTSGKQKVEAYKYLKRVLRIVSETTFRYCDNDIYITISCGIADTNDCRNEELSRDQLIAFADERLYHAKATGRNKIIYEIE